ncbi:MAG TPA: asparagine--tRNA ligase [Terracidiphilus sp.]|nr:asparagine--tRNA ligase [Terracidiphilus sp.]
MSEESITAELPKPTAPVATIATLGQHEGQSITIKGWLYNSRESGKLLFPIFRDGTGTVQGVAHVKSVPPAVFEALKGLTQESSVIVTGKVRADKRAPGGYELDVENIEVIQRVPESDPYPITPKEHGVDFLMEHRHLWVRSPRQSAILRIRAEIMRAAAEYFDSNGFIRTDPPVLTPAACEGTSTLFPVDYFGDPAYLTQSGQLYIESTALALGKVYSFGPTFRAEKSKTRRHLTEFWMIEPEVAFFDSNDNMRLQEDFVSFLVRRCLDRRKKELAELERDTSKLESVKKPFPRVSYDEAVQTLQAKGLPIQWGGDFGGPDETALSEAYDRPLMVHRYPAAVKAFYMKPDPERPDVALGVDVLAPEGYGEIIGGGQREDDLAVLEAAIAHHQLPQEAFEWYLDLRRYGTFPHAGFGLGIERTVAWICGLHHVRETIPVPRMLEKLTP